MAERQVTCAACGAQFLHHGNQERLPRFCSDRCKPRTAKPDANVPACRTLATCKVCGEQFYPKRAGRTTCCSRGCGLLWSGSWAGARKNGLRVSVVLYKGCCKWCSARFDGRGGYCGSKCRKAAACYKARLSAEAKHDKLPRECVECGTEFVPEYADKRRQYCSQRCCARSARRTAKAMRRAREASSRVERVVAKKVFDRDGWRCRLCGVKTPRNLKGTTKPNAPELDHIVPLSAGGEHSYRNTQCLCRLCNHSKAAGPGGQLLLFG